MDSNHPTGRSPGWKQALYLLLVWCRNGQREMKALSVELLECLCNLIWLLLCYLCDLQILPLAWLLDGHLSWCLFLVCSRSSRGELQLANTRPVLRSCPQ